MENEIILSQEEKDIIEEKYNRMLETCLTNDPNADLTLLLKAKNTALHAHRKQRRKTGEPYIYHPIDVAYIVCNDMKLDAICATCALLHDVVEDNDLEYPIERIEDLFGKEIAFIVNGLTKMRRWNFETKKIVSRETETIQKMIRTIPKDIRIIFIKIADRLHNMRTLYGMPANKQLEKTAETIHIYAPMAHRLGLYLVKVELEDLGLEYCENPIFQELSLKSKIKIAEIETNLLQLKQCIQPKLKELGIECEFDIRKKSLYTVLQTMKDTHITFEDVYQFAAIRLIFTEFGTFPIHQQTYVVLSVINDLYKQKVNSFHDHIKKPMGTGFQALIFDIMGYSGKWVEMQIIPKSLVSLSDMGYKSSRIFNVNQTVDTALDLWVNTLGQVSHDFTNADRTVESFHLSLESAQITCITKDGHLIFIRKGSTVLDFAYHIHSILGDTCTGAMIGSKFEDLDYVLQDSDQVLILTTPKQTPQKEWLDIARTLKAKEKIRDYFKKLEKQILVKGTEIYSTFIKSTKVEFTDEQEKSFLQKLNCSNKDNLLFKLGDSTLTEKDLIRVIKEINNSQPTFMSLEYWYPSKLFSGKESATVTSKVAQLNGFDPKKPLHTDTFDKFEFGTCCNPIAGEEASGYKDQNNIIYIHTAMCNNAMAICAEKGQKPIKIIWGKTDRFLSVRTIEIIGTDNIGIVHNVTNELSNQLSINIKRIYFESYNGIFRGWVELTVRDKAKLKQIIDNLKKIAHVSNIRIVSTKEDVFPYKENKF